MRTRAGPGHRLRRVATWRFGATLAAGTGRVTRHPDGRVSAVEGLAKRPTGHGRTSCQTRRSMTTPDRPPPFGSSRPARQGQQKRTDAAPSKPDSNKVPNPLPEGLCSDAPHSRGRFAAGAALPRPIGYGDALGDAPGDAVGEDGAGEGDGVGDGDGLTHGEGLGSGPGSSIRISAGGRTPWSSSGVLKTMPVVTSGDTHVCRLKRATTSASARTNCGWFLNRSTAVTGIRTKTMESGTRKADRPSDRERVLPPMSSLNSGTPFMLAKSDSKLGQSMLEFGRAVDAWALPPATAPRPV